MNAEIIQDDVLHALQALEKRGEKFDYLGIESSPFYVASSRKRLKDEMQKTAFLTVQSVENKQETTPSFLD